MNVGKAIGKALNDKGRESEAVRYQEGDGYLNDLRLESFGHLLADYILSGANITRDLKDRKKLTVSEGIISFGDQLWRVYNSEFRTVHIGTTYYIGFLLGQGYVFGLSKPVEKYLPLWEITTSGNGDILSLKDLRGELGRLKFKAVYDGVYLNTAEVQFAIDNAMNAANDAIDAAIRVDLAIDGAEEAAAIALNTAVATNLVKEATQVVQNETIFVKNETNVMKNETEAVKNATTIVKNETNAVKVATETTRNETILVKNETIVVKDATNVVKEDTLLVKNETNTVKNATEAVRVATNLVKDETNTVKNATNTVKDATLIVKAETETATQATKNATTAAITATSLSKTATDNVNLLIHNLEGLESRNVYSPVVNYIKNNIVSYGGSSHISKGATLGNAPTGLPGDAYWTILAKKGDVGEKGDKGEQGTGVTILGTLASESELPITGELGQAYLINGDLYVWAITIWENVGTIQGPQGAPGKDGTGTGTVTSINLIEPNEQGDVNLDVLIAGTLATAKNETEQLLTNGDFNFFTNSLEVGNAAAFRDDILSYGNYSARNTGNPILVIRNDGTLFYQGNDTDQRYANKAVVDEHFSEMTSDIDAGMFGDVVTGVPIDGGVWI